MPSTTTSRDAYGLPTDSGQFICPVSLNKAHKIEVRLAVPVDEEDLIPQGAAAAVETFAEETMNVIPMTLDATRQPVSTLPHKAELGERAVVGIEGVTCTDPSRL